MRGISQDEFGRVRDLWGECRCACLPQKPQTIPNAGRTREGWRLWSNGKGSFLTHDGDMEVQRVAEVAGSQQNSPPKAFRPSQTLSAWISPVCQHLRNSA